MKLRSSKKGSLELSANAIVIFVLAFVMLGVGLFITNLLKERAAEAIEGSFGSLEGLKQQPDAINTITVPDTISIKRGSKLKLEVGFYNKRNADISSARMKITQCIDEDEIIYDGSSVETPLPAVTSSVGTVPASSGESFKLDIKLKDTGYPPGTYICTLSVLSGETEETIEDSESFFLEVTA